jgi:(p)ppGpp synthase/HD superfamily hydrolase
MIESVVSLRPNLVDGFSSENFVPRTPSIQAAYEWGKMLHNGQMRLSGEPYFETHCVWVASFLDKLVAKEAWTIAGLLHDAVEDTGESLDQIRTKFPGILGEEIAYLVDGVTKISNPRDGRSREMETLRKIAMFRDPGVFLVKLADKSHNVMTLDHMPEEKRRKKANEAIRAYGKLAGILNCYSWRRWLEDMAFPHADAETYKMVKKMIDHDPRMDSRFINSHISRLNEIIERSGINATVNVTVNGYWQAWQKLRRMAKARRASMDDFSALNDLISFRVVVDTDDEIECYKMLAFVNRFYGAYLDQNRFDDYIACPQNGYRALQVTAWVPDHGAIEIAIMTKDMEGENLWGVVYALNHNKDTSAYSPIEILTPTGGARFLPEGSTVLDAVTSIQQEYLLDKISAVELNGRLARLSDKVNPGDVVEVITDADRMVPDEKWLTFANNHTRRILRFILPREGLKKAAAKGIEITREIIAAHGILNLKDVQALENDKMDNLLEDLSCASLDDLYAAIGQGAIRPKEIQKALNAVGLTKDELNWTSIDIFGSKEKNRPGILLKITRMISEAGGNILRSVNNTHTDGGYSLRLVVGDLTRDNQKKLREAFEACAVDFDVLEIV